ncbi:hypothetical protein Tco_0079515 [Tanacetum coccineum]
MVKYLEKAKSLISVFANFSISQVPISKDKKADALSKIASTRFANLSKQILVEVLKEKSIQEEEVATVVEEEGPTWMTPIIEYLKDETLPDDRKEASKLRIKARQYELLEGVLYRRSFLKPWLRKGQVFNNRYGLFHEVNRGESRGKNHRQLGKEVLVGQHMKHSQSNGLVERANRSLGEGINARLEAVIPAGIRMPTVRGVTFRPGDFVYCSNEASHAMDGGKLGQKWEGPYEVMEALGDGAYKLRSMDGAVLPRTWNIANLKKCYL